jgi:thioredoxin 1
MALNVTDGNIAEVLKENKITVLDFWAPWCGPCKMLGPIIEELATENADIAIGKVNVDDNSSTAVAYGIRGIPTIIFFKDGQVIEKVVGVKSKNDFQAIINSLKA